MEVHNPQSPLGRRLVGATNTVCEKGLRKTLGLHLITVVELTTVLTEIEHCINSHPLTYISDNPEYYVITPEGFLITKAAISIE